MQINRKEWGKYWKEKSLLRKVIRYDLPRPQCLLTAGVGYLLKPLTRVSSSYSVCVNKVNGLTCIQSNPCMLTQTYTKERREKASPRIHIKV